MDNYFGIDKIDQWFIARWSKFTASENYKLLTSPGANKLWSPGAITYIEERALQAMTVMQERPEIEEAKSILHGRANELPAYEEYVGVTRNFQVQYWGSDNPKFLIHTLYKDESGGTPDGAEEQSDGKVIMGVEIKCPKQPMEHFRRLSWENQWDVKENYILAYTQIQHLLMITGAFEWHFVSYDDRQIMRKNKIKIIEVKPDMKFQDNLELRIGLAIKEKYKTLAKVLKIDITNRSDFISYLSSQKTA